MSNAELAEALGTATGALVDFAAGAPRQTFPPIDISRIAEEFGVRPRAVLEDLPRLVAEYRKADH